MALIGRLCRWSLWFGIKDLITRKKGLFDTVTFHKIFGYSEPGQLPSVPSYPGSQKDKHRGTHGAKEGLSSIGRFRTKLHICYILLTFKHYKHENNLVWAYRSSL